VIDEHGSAAFDHSEHAAIDGGDLHNALDHLHRATLLIDDDGEGRSFDHGGEHRRVDREMGDSGVLDLEQQGADLLDHPGEAGRLRRRGQLQLAARRNDDIVAAADEGRPPARTRQQRVARSELAVDPNGRRLEAGMHDACIAAQLSHDPFVWACSCGARWSGDQGQKRNDTQSKLVHGSPHLI
jgi:hypothetical protein